MKKIYGFLGAAALLSMVACSKDDVGGANVSTGSKGDMFMTMSISPSGTGTRADDDYKGTTQTPNQGSEVGQDNENKIISAIVIVAKKEGDSYKVFDVLETNTDTDITGTNSAYVVTYKTDRNKFLEDVKGKDQGVEYTMFVVANPTQEIVTAYKNKIATKGDVQDNFSLTSDADTYWGSTNGFLMSNADLEGATVTIKEENVALGTHTTPADALSLGSVTVQRAMSRFDISTSTLTFKVVADDNLKSPIKSVSVEFDAVALVNMAQTAYMFKVTAADKATLGSKTISFENDRLPANKDHWAFSPDQAYTYTYPLFEGLKAGTSTGSLDGTAQSLESEGFTYKLLAELEGDRNTFDPPKDAVGDGANFPYGYKFWRYCMENTNPDDSDNQKYGNTTGVIFRAKIVAEGLPSTSLALYTYGNVVFGSATDLRNYVYNVTESPEVDHANDADVYAAVTKKYAEAIAKYNEATQEADKKFNDETGIKIKEATEAQLAGLDKYLVKDGKFTIYRRTSAENPFYCYYFYWNRHNNNYDNTQMGNMEFATVRNNVYKLYVSKVLRLGHPAEPGDDPDEPDPDDPDEDDEFYCQIECKILDWEVRINGIEF